MLMLTFKLINKIEIDNTLSQYKTKKLKSKLILSLSCAIGFPVILSTCKIEIY